MPTHHFKKIYALPRMEEVIGKLSGDDPQVAKRYKSVVDEFVQGRLKNLDILHGFGAKGENYFSIRGNQKDRVLVRSKGDTAIIVDYSPHEYDKMQKKATNSKEYDVDWGNLQQYNQLNKKEIEIEEGLESITMYGGKVFTLTDDQSEFLNGKISLPASIQGAPGSGKTVLARDLILQFLQAETPREKDAEDKVAYYIAPTSVLANHMQEVIKEYQFGKESLASGKIIIATKEDLIKQLFPAVKIANEGDFNEWKKANKVYKTLSYQEVCIPASCNSEEQYKALGQKQSSIDKDKPEERALYWNAAQEYSEFLKAENLIDLNIFIPENLHFPNGLVIADESQLYTNNVIKFIHSLSEDNQILFLGDYNQSLLSGVSNDWFINEKCTYIDKLTHKKKVPEVKQWPYSHRCPELVGKFGENVLSERQKGKEKQVSKFKAVEGEEKGSVLFFSEGKEEYKSFLQQVQKNNNVRTAVIVRTDAEKEEAKGTYGTALVYTPREIIGLEYENIILHKMLSSKDARSGEKGFLNELFVSCTRSYKNIYICGDNRLEQIDSLLSNLGINQLDARTRELTDVKRQVADLQDSSEDEILASVRSHLEAGKEDIAKALCMSLPSGGEKLFDRINKEFHERQAEQERRRLQSLQEAQERNKRKKEEEQAKAIKAAKKRAKAKAKKKRQAERKRKEAKEKANESLSSSSISASTASNSPNSPSPSSENAISPSSSSSDIPSSRSHIRETLSQRKLGELIRLMESPSSLEEKRKLLKIIEPKDYPTIFSKGRTILHFAVSYKQVEVVEYLLKNMLYGLIEIEDAKGFNACHQAISQFRKESDNKIINILLRKAPRELCERLLREKEIFSTKPEGFVRGVKELLEERLRNLQSSVDKNTGLRNAIINGKTNVVESVLETMEGEDLSWLDDNEENILHVVAAEGHSEWFKKIIKKMDYRDIIALDEQNCMPIAYAIENNHQEIALFLAKKMKKHDLTVPSIYRDTILGKAAFIGNVDIVKFLLPRMGDNVVMGTDDCGNTPLHNASCKGHLEVVKVLLKKLQSEGVIVRNDDGCTPLHLAAQEGKLGVVNALLPSIPVKICKEVLQDRSLALEVRNAILTAVRKLPKRASFAATEKEKKRKNKGKGPSQGI